MHTDKKGWRICTTTDGSRRGVTPRSTLAAQEKQDKDGGTVHKPDSVVRLRIVLEMMGGPGPPGVVTCP